MEEPSRLETVHFRITSRTPTVPCDCEILDAPTLSVRLVAYDAFYRVLYDDGARSDLMDGF